LPRGEPRRIDEGALVHYSVDERMTRDPKYKPVNLPSPAHYTIEGPPVSASEDAVLAEAGDSPGETA
jgi:hypothetical protein